MASGGIRSRILSATLNVLFWIAIICAICCILSGDELPVITFPVCLILCQQFIVTCSHCLHIIFVQSGSFFHVVPFFCSADTISEISISQVGRQVAGHASGFALYFQGRTGGDFIKQQPCLVH